MIKTDILQYLLGNLASFEAHLKGLRKIVRMRGGIDALGWPTLLKPLLNGYVLLSRLLEELPSNIKL